MTAKPPDPRHRAIELIEHGLTDAGCETSPHLARWLVARLEAKGLHIVAIPDHQPPAGGPLVPAEDLAARVPEYAAARKALAERSTSP